MFLNMLKIFISLASGYLFIKWFPIDELLSISDIIVVLVLNPVKFFASSVAFMAGFLINADLIKKEFFLISDLVHGKFSFNLLVIPLHIFSFYFLSTFGAWQTLIFLCLAIIYGMISLDFSGNSRRTTW